MKECVICPAGQLLFETDAIRDLRWVLFYQIYGYTIVNRSLPAGGESPVLEDLQHHKAALILIY